MTLPNYSDPEPAPAVVVARDDLGGAHVTDGRFHIVWSADEVGDATDEHLAELWAAYRSAAIPPPTTEGS